MNHLINLVKQTQKDLKFYAKSLPDQDAYAEAYSTLVDMVNSLNAGLKDLKPALKRAKADLKKEPEQMKNRAKKWCKF